MSVKQSLSDRDVGHRSVALCILSFVTEKLNPMHYIKIECILFTSMNCRLCTAATGVKKRL